MKKAVKDKMECDEMEGESMYKGKVKFTRDQLVFMVEASITAAFDRIEAGLPTSGISPKERQELMHLKKPTDFGAWDNAALETCGMTLGILYAQLTGDGLGIGDTIDFAPKRFKSIRQRAEDFIHKSIKNNGKEDDDIIPDVHWLSKAWTNEIFKDYLNPKFEG